MRAYTIRSHSAHLPDNLRTGDKMINQRLYSLLTVAETKSISKAAEILNLTQPAISQQIKTLENEFNCKIFQYSEGIMKITEQGEAVVSSAKRIQALYNRCHQTLKDMETKNRHISIGITRTAEMSGLGEILAEYCGKNPGTHIKIYTGSITNLYSLVKNYEADLIIVEGSLPDPSLKTIQLDTDSLVLAMGNENPLAQKDVITLDDLKKQKLILRLNSSGTRVLFEETLKQHNETIDNFNVMLEVNSIGTIMDLVRHNFGVSIMGRSLCLNDVKEKQMVIRSIENFEMSREINLVYNPDFPHQDILESMKELYLELKRKQENDA